MNELQAKGTAVPQDPPLRPPKPPLVFHVGITGHRPDPDKRPEPDVPQIREVIRSVLKEIKQTVDGIARSKGDLFMGSSYGGYGPVKAKLRILSALAEGGDQWVTEEALDLGYQLQAVLPFERGEYEKDFSGDALTRYKSLLERAPVVFELDGARADSSASYLAAGRQVLQQVDLLIAVWDGEKEKGVGGTGQIVHEALQSGVPVVWIQWIPDGTAALDPSWKLVQSTADLRDGTRSLQITIDAILTPPESREARAHLDPNGLRESYFAERQPTTTCLGGFWGFFLGIFTPRRNADTGRLEWSKWETRIEDFFRATRESWHGKPSREEPAEEREEVPPRKEAPCLKELRKDPEWERVNGHYFLHYAWANGLSRFYGGLHRSFFVATFLLGAAAVGLALVGGWVLMAGGPYWILITLEFVVIAAILALALLSRLGRWHARWLEYRTLAERLRLSRFMALAGGWRQQTSMPGHLAGYGDPVNSWVYWLSRAVERDFGLPKGRLDTARLEKIVCAFHDDLTAGQVDYHDGTRKRLGAVDRRLHTSATGLFLATAVLCAGDLAIHAFAHEGMAVWLTTLVIGMNAFLPACAAALAAIRNEGEFQRLSRRSEAMHRALQVLGQELATIDLEDAALTSVKIRHVIERIARLMLNETLDWRIVFQDRPPGLPA